MVNWELFKEQRWKIVLLSILLLLFLIRPNQLLSPDTVFLIHFYFRYLILFSLLFSLILLGRFLWNISSYSSFRLTDLTSNKPLIKKIIIGVALVVFLLFLLDQWLRFQNIKQGAGLLFLIGEFFEDYADLTEPCFTDEAQLRDISTIVLWVMDEVRSANLTCWIDFGTLLGAIRSEEIIYWDKDGDIGCLETDRKKIEQILKDRLPPRFTHREQKIGLSVDSPLGVNVDLFFYVEKGDYLIRSDKVYSELETTTNRIPKHYIFPSTATCRFGYKETVKEVACPSPPISFLKMRYPNTYNKVVTRKFSCFWQQSPKANTKLLEG